MTSKFQKRPFPLDKLIKIQSIKGLDNNDQEIELNYQDFHLAFINNQVCLEHKITGQIIPIARDTRLIKLIMEIEEAEELKNETRSDYRN